MSYKDIKTQYQQTHCSIIEKFQEITSVFKIEKFQEISDSFHTSEISDKRYLKVFCRCSILRERTWKVVEMLIHFESGGE